MEHLDNPAGQLLEFCLHVNSYRQPARTGLIEVVAEHLGVPATPSAGMYRGLAAIWELPNLMHSRVLELDNPVLPVPTLLRPVETAHKVVGKFEHLQGDISAMQLLITTQFLGDLENTSHVLRRSPLTALSDEEALSEIELLADEIRAIIAGGDLAPEFATIINDYLDGITRATAAVRFHGPVHLIAERDRMVGMLTRRGDLLAAVSTDARLRDRLWELLNKVLVATTVIATPFAISADAAALIGITTG